MHAAAIEMSLIGASFHKSMSSQGSAMPSRSASERQSMTMASSRSATSRQSDVSISVQDYSLERPRGSTPPVQSSFWAVLSDMRGSLYIVGGLVYTWEAFLGCLIAIASTLLCYFFEFQNDTSAVSTILGVVIVFPITALIGFAFSRREAALAAFSKLPRSFEKAASAASRRLKAKPMSAVIGNTITTPNIVLTALVSFWNSKK